MILALAMLCGMSNIVADPQPDATPVVREFDLSDATGKKQSIKDWNGSKAVVLLFIWSECPSSNGYAPELVRLFKDFAGQGVKFYGVHSDPDITAEQILTHAKEHRLSFPMLLDPAQSLARQTGAKRVPTAVILSAEGKVLYRGRIDDRYVSLGKKRAEPTSQDLRDALTQIVAGKSPAVAETEVIGCLLPKLSTPANSKPN